MPRSRTKPAHAPRWDAARIVPWALVLVIGPGPGCGTREATFVEYRARYECDFLDDCYPDRFELSCQPCTADDECALGSCNVSRGRCRDGQGLALEAGERNMACATAMDCGGLVCRQRYTSRDDCLDEQYGRDANDRIAFFEGIGGSDPFGKGLE